MKFNVRQSYLVYLILMIITALVSPALGGEESKSFDTTGFKINKQSAITRACEYLGVTWEKGDNTIDSSQVSAEIVVLDNDQTPFLHDQINGRPIWRINFKDIKLSTLMERPDPTEEYHRDFVALIDPDSGCLLKIYSPQPGKDSIVEPFADDEENKIAMYLEEYVGFPPSGDYMSLFEIIGDAWPPVFDELYAYLVRVKKRDSTYTVWSITNTGLPDPSMSQGLRVADTKRSEIEDLYRNIRSVHDAETGDPLWANEKSYRK